MLRIIYREASPSTFGPASVFGPAPALRIKTHDLESKDVEAFIRTNVIEVIGIEPLAPAKDPWSDIEFTDNLEDFPTVYRQIEKGVSLVAYYGRGESGAFQPISTVTFAGKDQPRIRSLVRRGAFRDDHEVIGHATEVIRRATEVKGASCV